ncbi:MAG TPA: hypothetical protein PKD67_08280 [Ignavibacteriaceae bacterium]|nr:hypothetical protein [Ignavibacteriaceae bacterium]
MKCFKISLIINFILAFTIYPQDNSSITPLADSINTQISIIKNELNFKNFFRDDSKNLKSDDVLFGLKLFNKAINDSKLVTQYAKFNLVDYSENEQEFFKESCQQLIEIAKKDYYKYDLGEVGRYLGISLNIMAIILVILSVTNFRQRQFFF